jgi:hypothetical protein
VLNKVQQNYVGEGKSPQQACPHLGILAFRGRTVMGIGSIEKK